ncbi:asparagine synthase (glutamine-hydrolysing) [Dysgonomonas alginatilytica]|uniref:asparagine synthase (glutamine-hydrolyzing) n=1 Tax=Dysgonomonas alginatilytica TaxID=1605892 RepID=A0A2V3PQL4_9BACT|nr:asparagine synthase B [Dysgonomonas alginatilytica]PXV64402.1 asparagine synthase (glutamine-hydrolysing) [Dysgonomonas alginatilytica]
MCGFVGAFDLTQDLTNLRSQVLKMAKRIRHRGPDWSGIYCGEKAILVHERLSIVDIKSGGQPLYNKDKNLVLAVNGEIYNHQNIRNRFKGKYEFQSNSDCEVLLALYQEKGVALFDELNGIYAFALYDIDNNSYLIGRDHMGIIPLYMGYDDFGQFYVASELKALEGICPNIKEFPAGYYYDSRDGELKQWYKRDWMEYDNVKDNDTDLEVLKKGLEDAVHRQLMSDVPYGVLLSGGLDSSIISAVAKKFAARRIENNNETEAWWPQLHSFAIGLEGAPDLIAAQKVADYIGTVHHEIHFTVEEAMDALSDVIYHIETYDVTTVRASTPMYLLARFIKSMGVKMVLSGEGSDEIFGGYLYFHKAPNAKALHEETVRKLDKLHLYDCLRANKTLAAWGVEGRVPFLDKEFMDIAMRMNPQDKICGNEKMEKYALRKAFEGYLPESVTWRQKEQFSDGVGYNWIDTLREVASKKVTDKQMEKAAERFPINPPMSKEEYWYRTMFEEHFPSASAASTVPSVPSVACSSAVALEWDASFKNRIDPSGRAVKTVHAEAYEN